jgi:hypothetical protein
VPLYDALAPTYDEHFAVRLRPAYDDLAWELLQPCFPMSPLALWMWDMAWGAGPDDWSASAIHLFDRDRLQRAFEDAGLADIGVRGCWSVGARLAASGCFAASPADGTGRWPWNAGSPPARCWLMPASTCTPGDGSLHRPGCRR